MIYYYLAVLNIIGVLADLLFFLLLGNALFLFCVPFFVAGIVFNLMLFSKEKDEESN